jgi:hypothetical protein
MAYFEKSHPTPEIHGERCSTALAVQTFKRSRLSSPGHLSNYETFCMKRIVFPSSSCQSVILSGKSDGRGTIPVTVPLFIDVCMTPKE